jgi:hypothetical protein
VVGNRSQGRLRCAEPAAERSSRFGTAAVASIIAWRRGCLGRKRSESVHGAKISVTDEVVPPGFGPPAIA